jgi:hypothetical protein
MSSQRWRERGRRAGSVLAELSGFGRAPPAPNGTAVATRASAGRPSRQLWERSAGAGSHACEGSSTGLGRRASAGQARLRWVWRVSGVAPCERLFCL